MAHRDAWETFNGREIPQGMEIRHKCDNPPCVNPLHLEIGTHKQNMQDMMDRGRFVNHQISKTHCPKGHEYDEENTYITPLGHRQCRACVRNRARAYYRKKHGVTKSRVPGEKICP